MMGNKDYLSGECDMGWCADLLGKLCYKKWDNKNQKMIIWLCQKISLKIWSKRGGPNPPPTPQKKKKKKSDLDSLSKFTY